MKKIKRLFQSEAAGKILLFFNENPHSIDTAKGISIWVGCDVGIVQKALDRLVDEGILVNHRAASTDAYSYTTQKGVIKKIERYIKTLR
ncbi:hypothetical protein ACFL28_03150 [Candidatus Omnitrophota bacterium]